MKKLGSLHRNIFQEGLNMGQNVMWEMLVSTVVVLILLLAIPNLTALPVKSQQSGTSTVNIQTAHSDLAEWNQVFND